MIRLIATIILQILASMVGLIMAALMLEGFRLTISGFLYSSIFFAVSYFIFEPLVIKLSLRYLPVLRGGIALVTTLLALWLTWRFSSGITISSKTAWILAPFIVWLSVILAGIVMPMFVFKKTLQRVEES